MSASPAPELEAIASQLLPALDAYDADVDRLVRTWEDLELYRSVSEQLDRIRMYSSALPDLRVHWVELLIAHAELVHRLWRTPAGTALDPAIQLREQHRDAIRALRNRCRRLTERAEVLHRTGLP